MQIVINIPDGCYEELNNGQFPIQEAYRLVAWIKNGTPLPKGHGRLEEGHWVEDIINGKALYSCSECLHIVSNYDGHFHYCPYCGKELKGVIRNDKNK